MSNNKYITRDQSTIKMITEIHFDILLSDVVRSMSALAETRGLAIPNLYDDNQEPKRESLYNPFLGDSDPGNILCSVCQLSMKYCDGHAYNLEKSEFRKHLSSIYEKFGRNKE
jgi:hypothetical protein